MEKKELLDNYFNIEVDKLEWKIYLMDFKASMENNPYLFTELKFKSNSFLMAYCRDLFNNTGNLVNSMAMIEEYNGENKEGRVLALSLEGDLIKESYNSLMDSITRPNPEGLGRVKGYLVLGVNNDRPSENVCYGVLSNPVGKIKLDNLTYVETEDGLDKSTLVRYKLKDKCDFFLFQNQLLSFNYKFEKIFKLQSTLKRLKMEAIDRIIFKGSLSNSEEFKKFCINFKSAKTFLALNEERLDLLNNPEKREEIATRFNMVVDEDKRLIIRNEDDSRNLLKHLCNKIIKDADSDNLYLVDKLTKLELNSEE